MRKIRSTIAITLTCSLVLGAAGLAQADPRKHDIGSGGQPTMTGSLGGSVIGSPNLLSDLVVSVNFGELSPINSNQMVKVVVPIAIRSTDDYQVRVSVAGTVAPDPNAVQFSDIGFGIQNFRPIGARAAPCAANSVINPLFNNDPASTMTINGMSGRAQYASSLANVVGSTLLINGPTLSLFRNIGEWRRDLDNGYAFDAIFVVMPQYYSTGTFTLTITFRMSSGPGFPCN